MTANDSVGMGLATTFATGYGQPGCSGAMTVVPDEVYSYGERIAYRDVDDVVHVTKERFSVTTSRHTQWVRYALGTNGYVTDGEEDADGWEVWRHRTARKTRP